MVKYNNQWGTVCDDGLEETNSERSLRAAQSACYTLGLGGGVIEKYKSDTHGPDGTIWLRSVKCASSSTNFLQCSHLGLNPGGCSHHEDVFLTCA